ncbi:MAG: hypothetical protein E7525_03345 [Ruminococcaceae bacterium]|nr:hypothetical protein [Oscillospiraceae bacterium]
MSYNTKFVESDSTIAKDKRRKELEASKPSDFTYNPYEKSEAVKSAESLRDEHTANKPTNFNYGAYQKSDSVKQAEALLQQQLSQKPGGYQSAWQSQLNQTLDKILNREKFSYDINADALYQQYKDQYMLQGQQAMMDTMGQAAAATGGYGNSYAQTVGQQTYQGYLQQLNDKVPEFYQMALNQYNQEGQDLYNQYGMYADREAQDYSRYRDDLSDYYTELNRLTEDARYQSENDYGRYIDEYNRQYGEHRDNVSDYYAELDRLTEDARYKAETEYGQYMDKYNIAYGQHRDEIADWQNELNRADNEYWNQYNREYGEHIDNKNFDYNKTVDDRNFEYNKSIDDRNYQYQLDRDKVSDSQWQQSFDSNEKWNEKEFEASEYWNKYSADAQAKESAKDDVYNAIQTGVTPSDEMIAAAGLDKDTVLAMAKVYKSQIKSSSSGSGKTATDKNTLSVTDHDRIVTQLQSYHDSGDNVKLGSYLDSLVSAGTISEAYADEMYKAFRVEEKESQESSLANWWDKIFGK